MFKVQKRIFNVEKKKFPFTDFDEKTANSRLLVMWRKKCEGEKSWSERMIFM